MKKLLERYGFHPCGRIILRNSLGKERVRSAYELIL